MSVPQNGERSSAASSSPHSRSRARGDESAGSSERHSHHAAPIMRRRQNTRTDFSNPNDYAVQPRQVPRSGQQPSSMNLPSSTVTQDFARVTNVTRANTNGVATSQRGSGGHTGLSGRRYSFVYPDGPAGSGGVDPRDEAIPISRTPSFDDEGNVPLVPPSSRHHYRRSHPNDRRGSAASSNSPTSDDVEQLLGNFTGFTVQELAGAVDHPQRRQSGFRVNTMATDPGLSSDSGGEGEEREGSDNRGGGGSSGSEGNLSGDGNVPNTRHRRQGPRLTNGDP